MERGIFRVIYHRHDGVRPAGGRVRGRVARRLAPVAGASFSPTCGATTRVGCEYVTLEDWDDLRKMVEHGARTFRSPSCRRRRRPHGIRGRAMEPYNSIVFTRKTLAGSSSS
jgi:hypothetical protein